MNSNVSSTNRTTLQAHQLSNSMVYRPDIQGLRGIAVLAVFLFHLDLQVASGGFVGVDVFFVISGFLIIGMIASQFRQGCFSYADFYTRRMKRILPVFQVVCFTVLVACSHLLLPTSLQSVSASLIASSLYASNLFFWRETTGYFGADSDELPLLHNWSLSVEEQFYIFFPFLAVLVFSRYNNRRSALILVALATGSFFLSDWMTHVWPRASFFLLPTRAWEFLLGGVLALCRQPKGSKTGVLRSLGAWVGIALIVGSIILLDGNSRFPGVHALWPCLGTALLIHAGWHADGPVTRALSWPPLVGVGTISYSVYLWHWPPVALCAYFGISLSVAQKMVVLVLVMAMSALSWRYVEQPFRQSRAKLPVTIVALVVVPLIVQLSVHWHFRDMQPFVSGLSERTSSESRCRRLSGNPYPEECKLGEESAMPTFALWGDSYADALVLALDDAASRREAAGYRFIMHSCPAATGVLRNEPVRKGPDFAKRCMEYSNRTFEFLRHSEAVRTVVINNAFSQYLSDRNRVLEPVLIPAEESSNVVREFVEMVKALRDAGKRVIVVAPYPEDKEFKVAMRRAYVTGHLDNGYIAGMDSNAALLAELEELHRDSMIFLVRPSDLMCRENKCRYFDEDGVLYLSDGEHPSRRMAQRIVSMFPDGWAEVVQNMGDVTVGGK